MLQYDFRVGDMKETLSGTAPKWCTTGGASWIDKLKLTSLLITGFPELSDLVLVQIRAVSLAIQGLMQRECSNTMPSQSVMVTTKHAGVHNRPEDARWCNWWPHGTWTAAVA